MGNDIGRFNYKRGEVGKAAYALAAAARIDLPHHREIWKTQFLPDVYSTAQNNASMNLAFLRSRHIVVEVTGISVESATKVVVVSVSADLSSLIAGILPFEGVHQIIGPAEARTEAVNCIEYFSLLSGLTY